MVVNLVVSVFVLLFLLLLFLLCCFVVILLLFVFGSTIFVLVTATRKARRGEEKEEEDEKHKREEPEAKGRGPLNLEVERGGGFEERRRGGAHRGWEGVWGVKYIFSGPKVPPSCVINQPQGKSNMHQIVVSILCGFRPPFPQGESALFRCRKTSRFLRKVLLFLQDLLYKSTVFPHQEIGSKYDAKVKPSQSQKWALCELLPQTQTVHSPKKCQGISLGNDGVKITPKNSLAINSQRITPKSLQAHASLG